ncbi:GntR family transcriptional regulator [Arthrobacter bambusae]|uniref:GntR family transcriptional regulator n=1 Tax=Arthrobacter bambusae TaxID=1338426 RepID=UPI001F50E1CC|nr:GntR family transcriptional regulator [Arthrobacter bambusae]MCI0143025.1 GntR family transcriptional regulator [Arthrobacter bambusae]
MYTANNGEGPPETLVAYASRRIQTAIAQGEYAPGSRLSPRTIAKALGISHIPVREALASLAARGYVDHLRANGYFTTNLTQGDLEDIYHWRRILEREAYLMAVPKLTEDDISKMRALLDEMGKKTAPEDRLRYLELNRQFHFVAFERTGSTRLLHFLNYLWDAREPYAAVGLVDSTTGYKDHFRLMPHFEQRNAQGVIEAMEGHREFLVKRRAAVSEGDQPEESGEYLKKV